MARKAKIKTIDVQAKKWFDKPNANTYFAGTVTINFKMETAKTFLIPFEYGYGGQYEHSALRVLKENGYNVHFGNLKEDGIIYRHNCVDNCKKKELKAIVKDFETEEEFQKDLK